MAMAKSAARMQLSSGEKSAALLDYAYRNHNPFGLETVLYEATLPGIAEEVAYRGVAFAMLFRGYGRATLGCSNVAAVFISAFAFGSVHALYHNQAGWQFTRFPFILAFLLGLWLRHPPLANIKHLYPRSCPQCWQLCGIVGW